MKSLITVLTFLMTAGAGYAQPCVPYFVAEFCMDGTYWDGVETREFDRMTFREDETTRLEVGFMDNLSNEDVANINIDRFKPLGDDIPAITNTSLFEPDSAVLIHTLYAVNGMMLWIITSETANTVSETHIQRHIEALSSIRVRL